MVAVACLTLPVQAALAYPALDFTPLLLLAALKGLGVLAASAESHLDCLVNWKLANSASKISVFVFTSNGLSASPANIWRSP